MDVQMPHCDGYEATKLIRKHSDPTIRNILIIAMTASAIQGDREKCLDSGMNNYLAKPVRAQTLKALLESYLSKEEDGEGPGEEEIRKEAKRMVKEALSEAKMDKETKRVVKGELSSALEEESARAGKKEQEHGIEDVKKDGGTEEGLVGGNEYTPARESAMAGVVRDERENTSRPSSIRQITAQRIPIARSEENASSSPSPS